jgi:hypothetical protein
MRCSVTLCSVDWLFVSEVSGQAIGPIFKDQAIQDQSTLRKVPYEYISQETSYFVSGKETLTL